ncbi:MAG: phosphoglycerate kinase [Gammaproteobacteria bacterium]|nr:phosphoglycerate kinase [Gammaproteobacteria bacterium]
MSIIAMKDLNLKNQRLIIRQDLNVPMLRGKITNDTRIRMAIPTLKYAINAGARVMVLSHLGRPEEGFFDEEHSLAPIALRLAELLAMDIPLVKDWLMGGVDVSAGKIILGENVRFNRGEKANDPVLSEQIARLCDIFVMDAFATAHRAEASTCGVIDYVASACAGPLLVQELSALNAVVDSPRRPVVAIVGGSKISTKLPLLDSLSKKVDTLIVGGGIANTFLAAQGIEIGRSLYEPDLIDEADRLLHLSSGAHIPLPVDVVVAESLSEDAESTTKEIAYVDEEEKILDIGPETAALYSTIIKKAGTILWNGPVGAFEISQFSHGTRVIGEAVAASAGFSIAGGGDTISAIDTFGLSEKMSYISTGGGAFLSFLEGEALPAVVALEKTRE